MQQVRRKRLTQKVKVTHIVLVHQEMWMDSMQRSRIEQLPLTVGEHKGRDTTVSSLWVQSRTIFSTTTMFFRSGSEPLLGLDEIAKFASDADALVKSEPSPIP